MEKIEKEVNIESGKEEIFVIVKFVIFLCFKWKES